MKNRLKKINAEKWLYTIVPFVFGSLANFSLYRSVNLVVLLLSLFFFTIPASFLINGGLKKSAQIFIFLVTIIWLVSLGFISTQGLWLGIVFVVAAILFKRANTPYSSWLMNSIYILPGCIAFYITGGDHVSILPVLAGISWLLAYAAFVTLPAMGSQGNKPSSIGGLLGIPRTLTLCFFFYVLATAFSYPTLEGESIFLGIIFMTLMLLSIWITDPKKKHKQNLTPTQRIGLMASNVRLLNFLAGVSLFLSIINHKLGQ